MKHIRPAVVTAVLCQSLLVAQGFGAPQIVSSVVANYGDPITADLDGDGDQDVIVFRIFTPTSGPTDWRIVWLANDGAGNFGAPQTVTTAVWPDTEVHAADLDGDGDIDLISAQTQQGKLAYYLNDGAGNFGSQQIIPGPAVTGNQTGWSPYSIDTADLDGDGDLDILTGYYIQFGTERVVWFANDGAANFSTAQIIDTTNRVEVRAGDLDGDGDEDVMGCPTGVGSATASYWLNDGTGAFGPMQSTPGGRGKFTLGDHDGDGDLDFVRTKVGGGQWQAWMPNDGQANFS
ncbi:MAG: FG-GAP-like repeat-containing protein, partial [Planctomycetota bacterium]